MAVASGGRVMSVLVSGVLACGGLAAAQSPPKLRALIFSGRNNHDWRSTTPFLKQALTDSGRFDVRVTGEPAGATAATLASYDVLVLDYCGPRWGEATETAVEDFLRSGKGMVVVHAASYPFGDAEILGDSMTRTGRYEPPWMEYRKMVGAWWSRKEPPITGHGQRHTFEVRFTRPDHPIAAGLGAGFPATDELYHNFRMMPDVEILATAFDDNKYGGTGKDEPVLWTVRYGKGRVFHTALGHNVAAMQAPGFIATLARGTEWAATGAVTLPARAEPARPKTRLLVVTGGHGYETSFYTLFEGYPDLAWDHAMTSRTAFRKDFRERYDVLLLYNLEQGPGEAERGNLRSFVESGKGVVILHHAIASYGDWPWWYKEVAGGKYALKNDKEMAPSTFKHGLEVPVQQVMRHPIVNPIGPMYIRDELYKGVWISRDVKTLLATGHPDADGPLAWISPYERARVVTILLGHDRAAHTHAAFRALVKNAIDWCAGRK